METVMIEAVGLQKRYGETLAVRGVDLQAEKGKVLGVLGPNGAGKSTTVRMLATMTRPDGGTARIGGLDVVADAKAVRRIIGVTGQDATLDELLTGTQNLVLMGRLSGVSRQESKRRAGELLEQFSLTHAAGRIVRTYSGGMRRRLDLAASLITRPPVLFLDEPTTGLDPTSRQEMWTVIRELVGGGTTVLLTTQYLDEADALASSIVVIDHGVVIARGTPAELKAEIGEERIEVTLAEAHAGAAGALAPLVAGEVAVSADGLRLTASVPSRRGIATSVIRALDGVGADVDDVEVHRPSLDDVFFALTGAASAGAPAESEPAPLLEEAR